MKTYISVGIGDMIFLDSILTLEEKSAMSEIYWACRFGKHLIPLLENNSEYPNLICQHTINDNIGKEVMKLIDPIAIPFWHFRPDFPKSFEAGKRLFKIQNEKLQIIDASSLFNDEKRKYTSSSFVKNSNPVDIKNYIVFHYPTSTRPRSDIATISKEDWAFVNKLSLEKEMKVIVISDCKIEIPLNNFIHLLNPDIKYIVDLICSCSIFAGCDSFCAHLAAKCLPKENIFIKSHEKNIKQKLLTSNFYRHFLPHSQDDISKFYKNYIGYP